jgi:serine/threonine-protein kinase HipA
MRQAAVYVNGTQAGTLREISAQAYQFEYLIAYHGQPISLTMPITQSTYLFASFPPFFEGLLPEGIQLEALLRRFKLDKNDYLGQLLQVGKDLVGAVTVEPYP